MEVVSFKCPTSTRNEILGEVLCVNGFADVDLIAAKCTFPAHRAVLGSISPYIRHILDEAEIFGAREDSGKVEIHLPDFEAKDIRDFLDFVYLPNQNEDAEASITSLMSFLGVHPKCSFPILSLGAKKRKKAPIPKPANVIRIKKEPSPTPTVPRKRLRARRARPSYQEDYQDFDNDEEDEDYVPENNGFATFPEEEVEAEPPEIGGVEKILSEVKTELQITENDDELSGLPQVPFIKAEVEESAFWSALECQSILSNSATFNAWRSDTLTIEAYNQDQSDRLRKNSAYRALVGVKKLSQGHLLGQLLAFSDPKSGDEITRQFIDTTVAMQELGGFSNGDLYFNPLLYTRQNLSHPQKVYALGVSLKEKLEKVTNDQLHKMMAEEVDSKVIERAEMKAPLTSLMQSEVQSIQMTTNLAPLEMDDILLINFHASSKQIFFSQLERNPTNTTESASLGVSVLFDVWCTMQPFIEPARVLLDKFKSVSKAMTVYLATKSVLESREVKCPDCAELFPLIAAKERDVYESHKRMHQIQNFSCDCKITLNNNVDRTNHIKLFHSEGKYKQCGDCEFIGTNDEVVTHRNQNHQSYICDVCGHVSENVKKHNNHILKHKVFKCKECGEEFVGSSKFSHHRADVHGKEFSCEECGKIIKGRWKWLQHVKSTHGGNRFMCDICGQGFKHKLTMKRHKISVHIKNRPFVCRYGCGADYNDECNLRTHEKRRHGGIYKKGDSYKDVYKNL